MLTTSDDAAIRFERVSKRFHLREGTTLKEFLPSLISRRALPSFYALEDVTFLLERGETVGIIGNNGSGKSTILKLIAGVTAPTSGRVSIRGRVSPLIELGAGFHPDLTGRENVLLNGAILGMNRRTIAARWEDIVSFAELADFMDTPVKHYSSGMFMRLGFSVAVHSDPDILIVDEALSVGDLAFQEKCLEKVREFQRTGVTIVLVSHNLNMIGNFCPRAIHIEHGRIKSDGPASDVIEEYVASLSDSLGEAEAHSQMEERNSSSFAAVAASGTAPPSH